MIMPKLKTSLFVLAFFSVLIYGDVSWSATKVEIDTRVKATLDKFYNEVVGGKELANKAAGILVFPSVIKAGIGIGGEYGEGALMVGGKTVDYYNSAAASIGFQLGAQSKSIIILFMTQDCFVKIQTL